MIYVTLALLILIALFCYGAFLLFKHEQSRHADSEKVLAGIIRQQQDFISKNINERVVHLNPGEPYIPDGPEAPAPKETEEEEDFEEPEEVPAEELHTMMEPKKKT